ncbi:MAG TPA: hypothetical protein VHZ06_08210 [Marmoricola sp.]|jgi:hypothetical protein|nr:hypothetical protein [Marmoricola sp.]
MLVIAVALVLISLACAVVLTEATRTSLPLVGRPVPVLATAAATTDWRGAALNAHTDSTNLQFAIVAALETEDLGHRDPILRSALRETGSRVPVRVSL